MTTGTEATMVRCRNGENSMILRDRRDSLLMGPNLEFDRRDTLVRAENPRNEYRSVEARTLISSSSASL